MLSGQTYREALHVSPDSRRMQVHVHPVCIFKDQDRVIGAVLGLEREGVIELTDSFPVPHEEKEKVAVDMQYFKTMYELHRRAHPGKAVVGWYATGADVNEHSVMIHDFFFRALNKAPVHLTVDTALSGGRMSVKAYAGISLALGSKRLGSFFKPLSAKLVSFEAERIVLERISRGDALAGGDVAALSDTQNIEATLKELKETLQRLTAEARRIAASPADVGSVHAAQFGEAVHALLCSLPNVGSKQFDDMFNRSTQDLLAVSYLATLCKHQLQLGERIQHAV